MEISIKIINNYTVIYKYLSNYSLETDVTKCIQEKKVIVHKGYNKYTNWDLIENKW